MKRFKAVKAEAAVGLSLIAVVVFGTAERHGDYRPTRTQPVETHSQISENIDRSLELNASAHSSTEWLQSGYTPEDIFNNIRALKNPAQWQQLCEKLLTLNKNDLSLFEKESIKQENLKNFPPKCQALFADQNETVKTGKNNSKKISKSSVEYPFTLTFEEDSDLRHAPLLLDTLSEHSIHATFFISAELAKDQPQMIQSIVNSGHSVGLLSRAPQYPQFTLQEAEETLLSSRLWLTQATGQSVLMVRFKNSQTPGEMTQTDSQAGNQFNEFLKKQGLVTIPWDVDSQDWKLRDSKKFLAHIVSEIKSKRNGIVRFQEISKSVIQIIPQLALELKHQGGNSMASLR